MGASPEKLHELLNYCIDFAKVMLNDSGDFYPFGATLSADGQVSAAGGYNGQERPAPQDLYRLLCESFTSSAAEGSIAAAALAANVEIPKEYNPQAPDGLRVHLESEGFSRFIYVPYVIRKKGSSANSISVTTFEPFAVQIGPTMFNAASDAS